MAERPRVMLAVSPRVEQTVERLLFSDDAPLALVASAVAAPELERLATERECDVVLLSPDLPGLTAASCVRLRAHGLRLVGLALDERAASALSAFGVDAIVDPVEDPEQLRAALAAGAEDEDESGLRPRPDNGVPASSGDGASVLAIVGSRGAPGTSEFAASFASLAQQRWPAVLVECDLLGGGIDLRLAADGHEGSLLGLVRACAAGDGALPELLERWLVRRAGWPPVLLAPAEPSQSLVEIARPGALADALHALAQAVPLVMCDVGFLLDEAGDVGPVARCHREALISATAVLLVIGARARQLRDGLTQLDLLTGELQIAPERLRVVCNGLGGPGTDSSRVLRQALTARLAERGLRLDASLPFDGRALRRAERHGLPLAVARRRGPYARALRRLLDRLFLPAATTIGAPGQRLSSATPAQLPDEEVSLTWRTS